MDETKYAKRGIALLFPEADALEIGKEIDLEIKDFSPRIIRNSLQYLKRSRGKKFVTKTIPDRDVVRVWRLK